MAGFVSFSLMAFASKMALSYILLKHSGTTEGSAFLYEYNLAIMFPASVCLFMCFKEISINSRLPQRIISEAAPLTLAVYLITEHFLLRKAFWNAIVPQNICGGIKMMLTLVIISLGVFLSAMLIEYIRRIIAGTFKKICS